MCWIPTTVPSALQQLLFNCGFGPLCFCSSHTGLVRFGDGTWKLVVSALFAHLTQGWPLLGLGLGVPVVSASDSRDRKEEGPLLRVVARVVVTEYPKVSSTSPYRKTAQVRLDLSRRTSLRRGFCDKDKVDSVLGQRLECHSCWEVVH